MNLIAIPFKYILEFLMGACANNYVFGIIVFTIVVNVALLPLNIKQQKTMAKQAKLRPKLDALKEKCGDDRVKYSNEMNELYQRENVSPTAGCLPMIIRLVIIIGVLYGVYAVIGYDTATRTFDEAVTKTYNFSLFGVNLCRTPNFSTNILKAFEPLWLIPLGCFAANIFSMIISNQQQKATNPQAAQAGGSMKAMLFMMPLISLWFTFKVPGAVGFYWICSSVVNTALQLYVNYKYSADRMLAAETLKAGAARREKEAKIKASK